MPYPFVIPFGTGYPFEKKESEEVARSYLNTPVVSNVIFQEFQWEDKEGNIHELRDPEVEGEGFLRMDTVLLTIRGPKNLVRTPLRGGQGSVNELMNNMDWEVKMNGKLVNPSAKPPYDLVEKIKKLRRAEASLPVVNPLLASLGIEELVMRDANINEQRGTPNEIPFTLNLFQDTTPEIELNEIQGDAPVSLPSF